MILIVKKPDYLGQSKWDLRYGKKAITAKINDDVWLANFQNRTEDVRPGDALDCIVEIEIGYGFDNEPISEHYIITKVNKVLPNVFKQGEFDV